MQPDQSKQWTRADLDLTSEINESLGLWRMPRGAEARLVNVSENRTFVVEGFGGYRSIIRVQRPGYHTLQEVRSELDWMEALQDTSGVQIPLVVRGEDGSRVQAIGHRDSQLPKTAVMFQFLDGSKPDRSISLFEQLGGLAARLHLHSLEWRKPHGFRRFHWDLEAAFGPEPRWGHWSDSPGVTKELSELFFRVEAVLQRRIGALGKPQDRFGLIHADMRLANLISNGEGTWLIDFDDCGFGWFAFDFAASVSFIEDDPRIPDLKDAWLRAYCRLRPLSRQEIGEIDSFVMMRRLTLLAWIGSRSDSTEPRLLADGFASATASLVETYLSRHS